MLQQTTRVTRIAHLSDVHMLERRPRTSGPSYDLSVRFVSFGRALDAHARMRRLARALSAAERSGADHVVVSGDLTEIGTSDQFEAFAEVLAESRIAPERITLVPGNHDAYTSPNAWRNALRGPLRPYADTSAKAPGHVVERSDVVLFPVDVACHQAITRSAGELTDDDADAVERRLADRAFRDRPLVIVKHHPPFSHGVRAWQWVDGLRNWARAMEWLVRHPRVHVLHGHLHKAVDRLAGNLPRSRIFGAPATVDDVHAPRVRLYDVRDGSLESAGIVTA